MVPRERSRRGGRGRPGGRVRALAAVLMAMAAVAAAAGCSSDVGGGGGPATPAGSAPTAFPPGPTAAGPPGAAVTGDITTGLDSPWGVALLPDGGALVASRDTGTIFWVAQGGGGSPVAAGKVPGSAHSGEGGLLGLALSPDFARDGWVYAYTTTAEDNRILRMKYGRDVGLTAPETVFTGIPKGSNHNGGRIAFGPDGMLYAGTGEAGDKPLSQDLGSTGGKILRMTPDGKPAPGNPFPGSVVYSLGHRNVQGLAWDSAGRLWAAEFGQNTWDELNLVVAGANYGWPAVEGRAGDARYVDPVAQWRTSEASPSGIAIVDDVVYMAGLRGERLWQIPINGGAVGTPVALFTEKYGRLRTVLAAPGGLWVTTSNTDGRGDVRDGDDRILAVKLG